MEAVTAGNEVALERMRLILGSKLYAWRGAVQITDPNLGSLEVQRQIGFHSCRDQILHDFVLAVDHHALARERIEVNAMASLQKAQLDAVMQKPFTPHPFADTRRFQDIDALMFQDPRPHATFHVLPARRFEHHGIDAASL